MTADDFAQSSDAAKVLLWPVRSTNRALPGGARGAFTMVLTVRTERRRMVSGNFLKLWSRGTRTARLCTAAAVLYTVEVS